MKKNSAGGSLPCVFSYNRRCAHETHV